MIRRYIGLVFLIVAVGITGFYVFRQKPSRTDIWHIPIQAPISGGMAYHTPQRIPFVFDEHHVYFSDYHGHVYALDKHTGKRSWSYTTNEYSPYPPTVSQQTVFIADFDSTVYALDASTGKERWRFPIPERFQPDTPVVVVHGVALVGARNGVVYALDHTTGSLLWARTVGTPNLTTLDTHAPVFHFGTLAAHDGHVVILSAYRAYISLDPQTGNVLYSVPLDEYIPADPVFSGTTAYIQDDQKTILAIDTTNGIERWKKQLPLPQCKTQQTSPCSPFSDTHRVPDSFSSLDIDPATFTANGDMIYFAGRDHLSVYALARHLTESQQGEEMLTSCCSSVTLPTDTETWLQSPMPLTTPLHERIMNFLSRFRDTTFTTSETRRISDHPPVYEITFNHDDSPYTNPWTDVTLSVVFTDTKGKTMRIQGFYYDHNVWKVRFAPPTDGTWRWKADIYTGVMTLSARGSFRADASPSEKGYLRLTQTTPRRLIYENGSPFWGRGIQDAIKDYNFDGNPINQWSAITTDPKETRYLSFTDAATYLKTYAAKGRGFNLYRLGIDNVSFRLWKTISPAYNAYSISNGMWADALLTELRADGYSVWMSVFGFEPPFPQDSSAGSQQAIAHYLSYITARYGALVDIWELANEATPSASWAASVAKNLKAVDPYHHPVTINWERPEIPDIDLTSIHWYDRSPTQSVDMATDGEIRQTAGTKPIVISEAGNKGESWYPESAHNLRVKLWISSLKGVPLIFWNQTRQYYTNPNNANVYLGPTELGYITSFGTFVDAVSSPLTPFSLKTTNPAVHAWWGHNPSTIVGYLYIPADPVPQSTSFEVTIPKPGNLLWYDPANGKEISRVPLPVGTSHVKSPAFSDDLVLRISF